MHLKTWLQTSRTCINSGLLLVNLKSVSEQQFLRALLLERHRKAVLEQNIVESANPSMASSFIGKYHTETLIVQLIHNINSFVKIKTVLFRR
jgi:hypothetical protein